MSYKKTVHSLASVFILCELLLGQSGCVASKVSAGSHKSSLEGDSLPKPVEMKDATLGPGDEIEVTVYRHDNLTRTIVVPPSGIIFVPLAGEMNVMDVSAAELRRVITRGMSEYIVSPQVNVEVKVRRSQKVIVLGEVHNPGVYTIHGPIHALEAIGLAGGFTPEATQKQVLLIRQNKDHLVDSVLNIEQAIKNGGLAQDMEIKKGDVLYIPPSFVTNVDRFFKHLETILRPIVLIEHGIIEGVDARDAITGKKGTTTTRVIVTGP